MRLDDGIELQRQSLDMTPLIDIIFLLVLFFAVSTSFISSEDLAKLKSDFLSSSEQNQSLSTQIQTVQAAQLEQSEEAELLRLLLEQEKSNTENLESSQSSVDQENRKLSSELALLQGLLDQKNADYQLEINQSRSELESTNSDLDVALQTIKELNNKLALEQQQILDSQETLDAKEVLLQKLVAEKAAELSNLEIKITESEESRVLIERELKAYQLSTDDRISSLNQQISQSDATTAELEEELAQFRSQTASNQQRQENTIDAQNKLQAGLSTYLESNSLGIERDGNNITLQLSDKILFRSGSATLKPEGLEILAKLGTEIGRQLDDMTLEIGGHTDSVPISSASAYADNWGLSVARAVNVVRFFEEEVGLDPTNMIATGFGEHKPVADNNTATGRAQNRRIEVILVPRTNQSDK